MAVTLPGRKSSYTGSELARIVVWTGFRGTPAAQAVAVILAESGGRTGARHVVGPTRGCPGGSIDRGLTHVQQAGGVGPAIPTPVVRQGSPSTLDQALDWVLGPLNWGPIGWLKSHIKSVVLAGGRYVYDHLRPLIHDVGVAAHEGLHLIGVLRGWAHQGFIDLRGWAHRGFIDVRNWAQHGLRLLKGWVVNTYRLAYDFARHFAHFVAWMRRELWGWFQWMARWRPTMLLAWLEDIARRTPRTIAAMMLRAVLSDHARIEDILIRMFFGR